MKKSLSFSFSSLSNLSAACFCISLSFAKNLVISDIVYFLVLCLAFCLLLHYDLRQLKHFSSHIWMSVAVLHFSIRNLSYWFHSLEIF
jgi:hypothetical protein